MSELFPDEPLSYWLLNLAVEIPVWLSLLFPVVESEALNVKNVPRRGARSYAANLLALFDAGMIAMKSSFPGDEVTSTDGVSLLLDRFAKLSVEYAVRPNTILKPYQRNRLPSMQVSYRLTFLGGNFWEGISKPDWSRVLSERRDKVSGELMSPDRDLILAYMGWYPEINNQQVQPETISWEAHSDFEILYWKRLPLVYRASFGLESASPRWAGPEPQWFQDWRRATLSWYKQPDFMDFS